MIKKQFTKPWQMKPIIAPLPEIISEASEGNVCSNNWTCRYNESRSGGKVCGSAWDKVNHGSTQDCTVRNESQSEATHNARMWFWNVQTLLSYPGALHELNLQLNRWWLEVCQREGKRGRGRCCGINERTSGRNLTDGEGVRNGIEKVKTGCLRVLGGDAAAGRDRFWSGCMWERRGAILPLFLHNERWDPIIFPPPQQFYNRQLINVSWQNKLLALALLNLR